MRPVLPLSILKRATALALILHLTGGGASARTWTTVTGENFEADFVRVEGANGIFKVKEKDYPYPLNRLSVPDRLFIGRIVNRQAAEGAAPPASSGTPLPAGLTNPESTASAVSEQTPAAPAKSDAQVELAGQALKPGGSVEIDIPILDPEGQREMQRAYSRPSSKARMLIAVPERFEPTRKSYPLLMVSSTTDGAASSIGTAHQYVKTALEKGFVVMAVDGEFGKPSQSDSISFRWALAAAGRDALEKEWPVATAGVSGGGGYASFHALKLLQERVDVIGIFLAVSPHNPTKFTAKVSGVPVSVLHDVPIFMSAGDADQTATRSVTDHSYRELKNAGFKKVRYEHFAGGHHLYLPHLVAALDWFLEGGGNGSNASPVPSTR